MFSAIKILFLFLSFQCLASEEKYFLNNEKNKEYKLKNHDENLELDIKKAIKEREECLESNRTWTQGIFSHSCKINKGK